MRALAILVMLIATAHAAAGDAGRQQPSAASFELPFHPEQCELAVGEAERLLGLAPDDPLHWKLLAEGSLCEGLRDTDYAALTSAVRAYAVVLRAHPNDLEAQLGLADARRKLFPLAPRSATAMRRAVVLARSARQRPQIDYATKNLAALRAMRRFNASRRRDAEARLGLDPHDLEARAQLVNVLSDSGPRALRRSCRLQRGLVTAAGGTDALLVYGQLLWKAGRLGPAAAVLSRARRALEGGESAPALRAYVESQLAAIARKRPPLPHGGG